MDPLGRGPGRHRGRGRARDARRSCGAVARVTAGRGRPASARSAIANAALHLGAGRRTKEEAIDHAVGVVCLRKRGDLVERGDVLAEVHARDETSAERAIGEVAAAFELGDEAVAARPLLLEVID